MLSPEQMPAWSRILRVLVVAYLAATAVHIGWVMAQGQDIVPLIGARTRQRLSESLGALDVSLSADELAEIARVIPAGAASGERYPAAQLAYLDSEK